MALLDKEEQCLAEESSLSGNRVGEKTREREREKDKEREEEEEEKERERERRRRRRRKKARGDRHTCAHFMTSFCYITLGNLLE